MVSFLRNSNSSCPGDFGFPVGFVPKQMSKRLISGSTRHWKRLRECSTPGCPVVLVHRLLSKQQETPLSLLPLRMQNEEWSLPCLQASPLHVSLLSAQSPQQASLSSSPKLQCISTYDLSTTAPLDSALFIVCISPSSLKNVLRTYVNYYLHHICLLKYGISI
jgi:hypothetical protein